MKYIYIFFLNKYATVVVSIFCLKHNTAEREKKQSVVTRSETGITISYITHTPIHDNRHENYNRLYALNNSCARNSRGKNKKKIYIYKNTRIYRYINDSVYYYYHYYRTRRVRRNNMFLLLLNIKKENRKKNYLRARSRRKRLPRNNENVFRAPTGYFIIFLPPFFPFSFANSLKTVRQRFFTRHAFLSSFVIPSACNISLMSVQYYEESSYATFFHLYTASFIIPSSYGSRLLVFILFFIFKKLLQIAWTRRKTSSSVVGIVRFILNIRLKRTVSRTLKVFSRPCLVSIKRATILETDFFITFVWVFF